MKEKKQSKLRVLLRMIKLVKPLKGLMILAVLMGTAGFLCAQFIPILGGMAILRSVKGGSLTIFWVLLPILALVRAILRFAEQRTNHYIAFTLLAIVRDRVFRALRRLCPARLEGRDKGDLISLITSDVELLEVFYAHTISPVCIAVLTETVMCLFIGSRHWAQGLLALIAFLMVGVLLPLLISKRSGTLGDELRGESGALAAFVLESIRGIDETIQYGGGDDRLKQLSERTDKLSARQGELNRLTGINAALANSLILFFDLCMLALCAVLYANGAVEFDGFLLPLLALMSSFGPVTALAGLGTTLQATVASGARILAILDEKPETEDVTGMERVSYSGAAFDGVSFSYGGEAVLRDLSLTLPENRIVGVVGKSGCGKSTMLRLLMRFWKTDAGTVSVSGRSVERINTEDLRRMESYTTQEVQLFRDTVAGNVRIGNPDAGQEEIEEACRKASVHDFILSLPDGYETQVGELGDTLSGGERQRIGLARAFLHDAPLMLLDEPTSNLDSLNEAVILKSLREESAGKTVVLVTHRPSTARIADEILRMESGRVS